MEQFYTIFDDEEHKIGFVAPFVYEPNIVLEIAGIGSGLVIIIGVIIYCNKIQSKKAKLVL